MSEELPTAAKVVEKDIDWEGWHGRDLIKDTRITDKDLVEDGDELVRRQDVIDLIDRKLDQVYEKENNASAEQEIATAEMLMKILEIVAKNANGESTE